jgi:pimeloyl-ACP methyl ester carboxylesterase
MKVARIAVPLLVGLLTAGAARDAVKVVAPERFTVTTSAGSGTMPIYLSAGWNAPFPQITRALIIIHGRLRNADSYFASGRQAVAAAGAAGASTLLIAPQFLDDDDIAAHDLPATVLRWSPTGWMAGLPAHGGAPLSSFDVLDALLAHLADHTLFPHLTQIVIAGHSGGGQVTQRYAVLGRAGRADGIALRYVIANPSSYAWFTPDRPRPVDGCPTYDEWKYGLKYLPPYAGETDAATLESRYITLDIRYLIGGADTNPALPILDKTCPAEAQGADHLSRGENFFAYLRARHPDLQQQLAVVPGVGHNENAMLTSPAGLQDLFR